jgi:hypothetical protein
MTSLQRSSIAALLVIACEQGCTQVDNSDLFNGGGANEQQSDARVDAPKQGADGADETQTDASAENAAQSIACGGASCEVSSNACCISVQGASASVTSTCEPWDTCLSAGGLALRCRSATDCRHGAFCCTVSGRKALMSECMTSCMPKELSLCDLTSAKSTCAPTQTCLAADAERWPLPSSMGACVAGP